MSMKLEDKFHELPEQHRALLVVMFLLVVAGVLYGMFFLRPQWKAFSELVSEHASVDKKLSDSSWPKDSARLNSLLQSYQQKLVGMKKSVKDGDAVVSSIFALFSGNYRLTGRILGCTMLTLLGTMIQ